MKISTVLLDGSQVAVVVDLNLGVARVADLFDGRPYNDALDVIRKHSSSELQERLQTSGDLKFYPLDSAKFLLPYRNPRIIVGIGLNYRDHAGDLKAPLPTDEPASFIKGNHTLVGPGEPIVIPWQSSRTTSEAELGIVVGRICRDIEPDEALDYVWGVVPILDQTAEDILERNPRFLTRSKNFPTFLSFGPWIVSMDEIAVHHPDIATLEVSTVRNGDIHRSNTVANMTFSPEMLLSFHSKVMPFEPGDIISTGTPGATRIAEGDVVEARISNVGVLRNPVIRQRNEQS